MKTFVIILFGALVALLCIVGVLIIVKSISSHKTRHQDAVIRKKDGTLGYAYDDDKVHEAEVVVNMVASCIVRTADGKLYFLRRTGYPVGTKIVIAVRSRPSKMDKIYLKPYVLSQAAVTKKSDTSATILCRLNEDIVVCGIYTYEELWDIYVEHAICVKCTVKEQHKYAVKSDGPPENCQAAMLEFGERDEPYNIPIRYTKRKVVIKACLQKKQ